jgi:hypothetical protein
MQEYNEQFKSRGNFVIRFLLILTKNAKNANGILWIDFNKLKV